MTLEGCLQTVSMFTIVSYQANLELEKTYEWKKLEVEDESILSQLKIC